MVDVCGFIGNLCGPKEIDDGVNATDRDARSLSHVGMAAYQILRVKHNQHHHKLWNVSTGNKVIGELHQTPTRSAWENSGDPDDGHDDWFPEKMAEIMSRTKYWCDIMSLGPPDGVFLEKMKEALQTIARSTMDHEKPVMIRMMFGNIVGMPVDCEKLLKELTRDLPEGNEIQLWVGAWRAGQSVASCYSISRSYLACFYSTNIV